MIESKHLIYLAQTDESVAANLSAHLEVDGYRLRCFIALNDLEAACDQELPAAIIIDVGSNSGFGILAGTECVAGLQGKIADHPPTIFLAIEDNVESRLVASRAGISRSFGEPLDIDRLRRTLNDLIYSRPQEPSRVMLLINEETQSESYAQILREAGLEIAKIDNALESMRALNDFRPDILVLDYECKGYSAIDLASAMRQDDTLARIPIIALCTEEDLNCQNGNLNPDALHLIRKPVGAELLKNSVLALTKGSYSQNVRIKNLENSLKENRLRLKALDHHDIVSITDVSGRMTSVNDQFCAISGYSCEELLGQYHRKLKSERHDSAFYKEMWKTIAGGNVWHGRICNLKKDGGEYWVESTIVPCFDERGKPYKYVSIRTDITERMEAEANLRESERSQQVLLGRIVQQKSLLDTLRRLTTDFVAKGDFKIAMKGMLDTLLEISGSEYGFTGEVFYKDDGIPYLVTNSISNIAWNPETLALYKENEEKGFKFHNLNTLFGHVISSRQSVVSNDPASDPRSGILPEGHPPLHSFLGVPISYGGNLIGMYGIANRENGYDEEIQEILRPFNMNFGVMIHSRRMMDEVVHHQKVLTEAKNEAEEANRSKSQFLSNMSHELRTPLNAVIGFSQLMQNDDSLSEEGLSFTNEIIKAGRHLLELINEILDLARIETGRTDLSIEAIEYAAVIEDTQQLIMPLAKKRGIEIKLKRDGEAVTMSQLLQEKKIVQADRTRLKQVLLNILSNAVKYNCENGTITIAADTIAENRTRISIIDTGNGLSQEQQDQLFQAFNRLGAEQKDIEGTGIGLVICKDLMKLMGGKIGVDSKPGLGSSFWIELANDALESSQIEESSNHNTTEIENLGRNIKETKLLYIEDNPANLRLIEQLLRRRPEIRMMGTSEPISGLEMAAEYKPDLILLDINLPDMDGFEVLRRLRLSEAACDIPIIAISANAMPGDIKVGLEAGFFDYITKPINIPIFLQVLDRAVSQGMRDVSIRL